MKSLYINHHRSHCIALINYNMYEIVYAYGISIRIVGDSNFYKTASSATCHVFPLISVFLCYKSTKLTHTCFTVAAQQALTGPNGASGSNSGGIVAGVVVGAVALTLIIVGAWLYVKRM